MAKEAAPPRRAELTATTAQWQCQGLTAYHDPAEGVAAGGFTAARTGRCQIGAHAEAEHLEQVADAVVASRLGVTVTSASSAAASRSETSRAATPVRPEYPLANTTRLGRPRLCLSLSHADQACPRSPAA